MPPSPSHFMTTPGRGWSFATVPTSADPHVIIGPRFDRALHALRPPA